MVGHGPDAFGQAGSDSACHATTNINKLLRAIGGQAVAASDVLVPVSGPAEYGSDSRARYLDDAVLKHR